MRQKSDLNKSYKIILMLGEMYFKTAFHKSLKLIDKDSYVYVSLLHVYIFIGTSFHSCAFRAM